MATRVSIAQRKHSALPIATYALILAQVAVWLVVRRFLLTGNEWTSLALRPGTPSEVGFLISPFVHLEPAHLGINLTVLWLFGTNLERAVGSFRFLFLYLACGWFGALMHWATATSFHLYPDLTGKDAAIGSSGAVAGILAASVVRFAQPRLAAPFWPRLTFPAMPLLVMWLVYTVVRALVTSVQGVQEGIGHWSHLAGFILGLGLAQLFRFHRHARLEYLEHTARDAAARHSLPAAAEAWSALLSQLPDDMEVRSALMQTRAAMGDLPGARRLARDGIAALVKADRRDPATQLFRQALRDIPDLDLPRGVRYRLGCWLADAGEAELAFAALWDSVREDGATPSSAGALYRAGQIAQERLRSPRQARDAWLRLLEQFPDSPWSDAAREGLQGLPAAQ